MTCTCHSQPQLAPKHHEPTEAFIPNHMSTRLSRRYWEYLSGFAARPVNYGLKYPQMLATFISKGIPRGIWLFPKIRDPILVAPITRTTIHLGLFLGPLFMEAPIWVLSPGTPSARARRCPGRSLRCAGGRRHQSWGPARILFYVVYDLVLNSGTLAI